ncbi:GLABROUS1 enhancer-binding protein-like [Raphanus sativus]|uniref:GLABROUS1 enhancer-binding protein-like n=1 Tax=Raphanus sativus TaxID=3726 RepID=A0A6J0N0M2_RAPSA|nr:GLABROUS1 enhancer-binding protein-like [Raphanus sativus]
MAPKQADKIENPPVASSSEEEEEESGSSGEESDSSDEEAGDVQSKLTQKPAPPPPASATKKSESDSEEGETESESDSDSEPATKTKPLNTVATKPIPPESSTAAKRSLKQADNNNEPKKKAKTSSTTEQVKKKKPTTTKDEDVKKKISGEEAKKMLFQRLFSETDEIAMLQGFLDFTSTKGDPYENMDAFCDYVKTLIDFNASKAQIVTKLQRCKKKFANIVKNALKKGKTEDKITCAKDLDQKAFELSRKIWGSDGVLPAKPRKKKLSKEDELVSTTPKKEVVEVKKTQKVVNAVVVDTHHLSESREMGLFFKKENVSVLGLDESTVSGVWDRVEDGGKKREMEEKLKKLRAKQMELCLQRTALVDYTAKIIFKNNAPSTSS